MYVVVGRVEIKPGHEDETRLMIENGGIDMVRGMPGSGAGYWARGVDFSDRVQHSFWLFDTEEDARASPREHPAHFATCLRRRLRSSALTSARSSDRHSQGARCPLAHRQRASQDSGM